MTSQRTSRPLWTDWTQAINTAACGSSQLLVCMLVGECCVFHRAASIWAFRQLAQTEEEEKVAAEPWGLLCLIMVDGRTSRAKEAHLRCAWKRKQEIFARKVGNCP